MSGEKDLQTILKTLNPVHNPGDYVFCIVPALEDIQKDNIISFFKEDEGYTIILRKELADELRLEYSLICSWITLNVHSSLQAVGLTAAFSSALSKEGISCNVVAAYYHDHIFVDKKDTEKALMVLKELSK